MNEKRNHGYTLLEVLLTISLLAVLSAILWPALSRPFANQRLKKAADQVRAEWTAARVKAMSTGLTHSFRYQPDSGQYRVERWDGFEATVESTGQSTADVAISKTTDADPAAEKPPVLVNEIASPMAKDKHLPQDVTFVISETLADARADTVATGPATSSAAELAWSPPILFYPDGTTSTARLLMVNEHNRYMGVELRGLTGVATVSELDTQKQ